MTLILVALAAARIVQWIKEIVWWPMRPAVKGGITIVISIGLCIGLTNLDTKATILVGLAAAGLASIIRAVWRYLYVAGDERKLSVILNSQHRRS